MASRRNPTVILVGGLLICATARGADRNHRSKEPRSASDSPRLIAGNADSVRDGIDSGTLATGSGPRVRIKPVQILSGQGSINGDTISLASGPALLKFDVLFGGWGTSGGGLTTFQTTLQGTCIGGLFHGLPGPPNDCSSGGGSYGNATGTGSPLDRPHNSCVDQASCVALFNANNVIPPADLKCNDFFAGQCTNYWQENGTRPDWPGFGSAFVFNILGCGGPINSCGGASSNPPLPDDGNEKYSWTFVLAADANARGRYTLTGNPLFTAGNFMQVADGTVVTYATVIPAYVMVAQDDTCVGGSSNHAECSQHSECPGGFCQLKNRFISFIPSEIAPTGGIQVTLVSLDPNSVDNPAAYNGTVRWAGTPAIGVNDSPSGTYNAAALQCAFHSQDWTSLDRLHMYGPEVVPGSRYDVRICSTEAGPCSAPLRIETAKFGDIVAPVNVTNFQDITSILDKFRNMPGSPIKARTKLTDPIQPHTNVNFQGVSAAVSAFQGKTYKDVAVAPPPTCP